MSDETEREELDTGALRAALYSKLEELRDNGMFQARRYDPGDRWLDDAVEEIRELMGSPHRHGTEISDSDLLLGLRSVGVVLDSYQVRFEQSGTGAAVTLTVKAVNSDHAAGVARDQIAQHVPDPDAWHVADVD